MRCGRALLALTETHPELASSPPAILEAVERELKGPVGDDDAVREHVFNLLALVLEREPVLIASRAFDSGDMYVRVPRSSISAVLPSGIFAALVPRLSAAPAPVLRKRGLAVVRAELLDAGATIRVSRAQILQELSGRDLDGEG